MRNKHRWYAFDKLIREKTKNEFKPLDRRTKTIKSYWDFYKEAGIFRAIGKEIRQKYSIPNLDPKTDLVFYTKSVNVHDDVELEDYVWLSESGLQKQIEEEIAKYLKLLKLPINAADSLKYWILYNKDMGMYPTLGIIDLIYDIALGTHYADEHVGYTSKEVTFLIEEAKRMFKDEEADKLMLNRFIKRIDKYKRTIRPLRNAKDKARIVRLHTKKSSQDIAQLNVGDKDMAVKEANKKAAAIRKQIQRLYKELPFLRTLLDKHK